MRSLGQYIGTKGVYKLQISKGRVYTRAESNCDDDLA